MHFNFWRVVPLTGNLQWKHNDYIISLYINLNYGDMIPTLSATPFKAISRTSALQPDLLSTCTLPLYHHNKCHSFSPVAHTTDTMTSFCATAWIYCSLRSKLFLRTATAGLFEQGETGEPLGH